LMDRDVRFQIDAPVGRTTVTLRVTAEGRADVALQK
jgi:hypothetical protein